MSEIKERESSMRTSSSDQIIGDDAKIHYNYKENDPQYMGDKLGTDRNLIHGPTTKRGFTDCFCSLLFIGFIAGLVFTSIYAFSEGSPYSYSVPFDTDGNACGKTEGFIEYKYILLLDPNSGDYRNSVCVSHCPTNEEQSQIVEFDCKPNSKISANAEGKCQVSSDKFVNTKRFVTACIPDTEELKEKTKDYLQPQDIFEQHLSDLQSAWPVMLGSIFISLTIGYIYLLLMKKVGGCLTWFCILTIISSFFVVGGLMVTDNSFGILSSNTLDTSQKDGMKVLGSFSILFGAICFLYIVMGIALVNCSTDYTQEVCSSQMIPLVMWLVYVVSLTFLMLSGIWAYGIGTESKLNEYPYERFEFDSKRYLYVFYIIGLIWFSEFISIYSHFLVSSSAQQWYFKRQYSNQLKAPVRQAVILGFYHLGTLAYASLVLPIYAVINFIFELFYKCGKSIQTKEQERKRRQSEGDRKWEEGTKDTSNQVTACCISCSNIYEGRFRFVSKQGIIQTALTGRGFKSACHDSFYLMRRHEKYFSSLYGIGSLMLLLGKLFICCSSTFLCYLILSDNERFKHDLYSPILPTIVIAYITFTIGNIFVTVYSSSSDSILQCYCVDEELHNEMKESTNNTPQKLTIFLDKYTDIIKDQKALRV